MMGKNIRRVAVWAALGSLLAIPWMETVGISQIGVPKPGDTQGDCIYGCKQGESFYVDLDGTAYETEQPVCSLHRDVQVSKWHPWLSHTRR